MLGATARGMAAVRGILTRSSSEPSWLLSAAVAASIAAIVLALTPVFRPGWWVAISALVMVVAVGGAGWLRARRTPALVASGAPAVAAGIVLALVFGRDGLLLGVVPTADTARGLLALTAEGVRAIGGGAAPIEVDRGAAFLLAAGLGALTVLVDALAFLLRAPALAGIPLLVVLAVPSVVLPGGFDPVHFAVAASAYAFLLRAAIVSRENGHRRPPGGARHAGASPRARPSRKRVSIPGLRATAVGAVVVSGAIALPHVLPASSFVLAGPFSGSEGGGEPLGSLAANPIVALGDDLRSPQNIPALDYTSTDESPAYLRMAVLTEFEPQTWVPSPFRLSRNRTVDRIGDAPGLASDVAAVDTTTDVRISGAYSRWLPTPYPSTSIDGLDGKWYWEPDGLSVRSTDVTTHGQDYRVESSDVRPTREQLASAPPPEAAEHAAELSLPRSGLPESIVRTALKVTNGRVTAFDRALALQEHLRAFSYSELAPVDGGYDGSGPELIARFLEQRSGYCVHFSSAMALMARVVGIPARVAVGYTPGERSSETRDGLRVWEVGTRDAHAWPELYFERVGWVAFEPTPGRGDVPAYATPEAAGASAGSTAPEPLASAPPVAPQAGQAPTDPASLGGGQSDGALTGWAGLLVGLLLLAPALARAARRWQRFARLRRGRGSAADAWRELHDAALDLGIPFSATETPRAFADRLSRPERLDGNAFDALHGLRSAFERESFGRSGLSAAETARPDGSTNGARLAGDCATVLAALYVAAPRKTRLRAIFLPASLLSFREQPQACDLESPV